MKAKSTNGTAHSDYLFTMYLNRGGFYGDTPYVGIQEPGDDGGR